MKRPALPDAVSWGGAAMRHRPFLLLDFRPCIRTGNRCFSMGGACLHTGLNRPQTGGEGYFLDLAHKIATRGRQAAHRGALSSVTSPEPAVLFLLLYRETASQSPGPVMLLQKSVPSHPSECLISVLHGRPQ